MLQDLLGAVPFVGWGDHVRDQILGLLVDELHLGDIQRVLTLLDGFEDFRIAVAVERRDSGKENV